MAILLGDPGTVHFGKTSWWAEGGLIHWEDQESGKTGTQTVRTCLNRLQGINDMIGNTKKDKETFGKEAVHIQQNYIDQMAELCKKAQQQGDPSNPAVMDEKLAGVRAKRQSSVVVLPGLSARF